MSEKLSAVGRASLFILFKAMTAAIVVLALRLRKQIEVRVRPGAGRQIEVELDRNFRVVEVDNESLGDE